MVNRRTFLQLLGLTGAAAATGVALAHYDAFDTLAHDGQYRVLMTRNAIGTHVDITALGPSQAATEDAVHAAFEDVAQMEQMLTRFGNTSPVCELNAEGRYSHIPEPMVELLGACAYFHQDTAGAFDITVKPLLDLMQQAAIRGRNPSESEIGDALAHVGADRIQAQLMAKSDELRLAEGMGITLDGAAPGFIADRVAQILREHGIRDFLVNAGGEIRTAGHPAESRGWRIAIQDPQKHGNYPGFLELGDTAVSTSGNYEIYYGADRAFHHIVDARSGHSPARASVTVTAPTALEADILSTALFVMTPQDALRYVERHPQYACLIIDNDGNRTASPNLALVT